MELKIGDRAFHEDAYSSFRVARFSANAIGLYDMEGDAME